MFPLPVLEVVVDPFLRRFLRLGVVRVEGLQHLVHLVSKKVDAGLSLI